MLDAVRYQRGQRVTMTLALSATPDTLPVATITDPNSTVVATLSLPMAGDTQHFTLPLLLWGGLILGTYQVTYSYAIGGVGATSTDSFTLVGGGDSGGDVISLYSYDRPEGKYVIAQLSSGRLVQGRNPRL